MAGRERKDADARSSLFAVGIDFAGRRSPRDPIHKVIAALNTGDALCLRQVNTRWELRNTNGQLLGCLANAFTPPPNTVCISAHVGAILQRLVGDVTDPKYRPQIRCECWEVVLPELVFAPENSDNLVFTQ